MINMDNKFDYHDRRVKAIFEYVLNVMPSFSTIQYALMFSEAIHNLGWTTSRAYILPRKITQKARVFLTQLL